MNSNLSYSPETVKLGCDLCDLDLWPRTFAWTLLWSLVITPENFMMLRWWEHSQKGMRDGQTDRQTENTICRAAWSQLKTIWHLVILRQALCIISKPLVNSNWSYSPETLNSGQDWRFFFAVWPWNLTDDIEKQYGTSSILCQAEYIISNHWWIQTGVTVQKLSIRVKIGDFICRVTLKFGGWLKVPLLCYFKLCTSFHSHQWIQAGITAQKRPIRVKIDDFFCPVWP